MEIKTYEEALNYIIANKEKIPSLLEYELMTEDEVISYAYEIFEEINKPSKEPFHSYKTFIKPTLKAKDGYEIININFIHLESRYYQYLMIRYK